MAVLLQRIFLTHRLNPGLLPWRQIPALQADSLPTELQGKPVHILLPRICENLPYLAKGDFKLNSVMSDSVGPHGLQHARLLCPLLSPGVCSNSCPLRWWYYVTISSSAALFSSCPQSFPASGSFPIGRLFTSDGQNIGASASVLPMNFQGLISFRTDWLIYFQNKGLSRVFSSTTVQKHQFFSTQPSLWSNDHISIWLLEKS